MADIYTDLYNKLSALAEMPLKYARVKGPGYFGTLPALGGKESTEISIGVNGMEIPSLVPTLSREEIDYLLGGKKATKSIVDKAYTYAKKRQSIGKSPFAQRGELEWPLPKLNY
jgi:hypothetical protein